MHVGLRAMSGPPAPTVVPATPSGVKSTGPPVDMAAVSLRHAYGIVFLVLALGVWTSDFVLNGFLRGLPVRLLFSAMFVTLALTLFLRERRSGGGTVWRFGGWSRRLLAGAWALGALGVGMWLLVDYDDECQAIAGAGWHPVGVVFALAGLLVGATSALAALVESAQRRTVAAGLTLVVAFLSLYPLFVAALLVGVGCDHS